MKVLFRPTKCIVTPLITVFHTIKPVHIFGLLSPGGVHAHEDHINAMVSLAAARGAERVYVHAFLDGRDCPPRSAEPSLLKTQELCESTGVAKIGLYCWSLLRYGQR